MIYPIQQAAYEIFEDILTVQNLQCSKQWLWCRPGVNTENNPNSPILQNEKEVLYLFYTQIPKLGYNMSFKDIWTSNTNTSEIHCGVLF